VANNYDYEIGYNYRYAKYTQQLNEVLEVFPELLDDVKFANLSSKYTSKLKDYFKAIWGEYEISGETIPLEKLRIKNCCVTYIPSYEAKIKTLDELLTNDFITSYKGFKSTTKEDAKDYDLPRKTTTENTPSNHNTSINDNETTYINNVELVKQVEEISNLIEELIKELVYKFSPCFLDIYG